MNIRIKIQKKNNAKIFKSVNNLLFVKPVY